MTTIEYMNNCNQRKENKKEIWNLDKIRTKGMHPQVQLIYVLIAIQITIPGGIRWTTHLDISIKSIIIIYQVKRTHRQKCTMPTKTLKTITFIFIMYKSLYYFQ